MNKHQYENMNELADFKRVAKYGSDARPSEDCHKLNFRLAKQRQAARDVFNDPQVGDFVTIQATNKTYVISHNYDERAQLSESGSLNWKANGKMVFSGGLDSALPKDSFTLNGKDNCDCWFFSRDQMAAHSGVYLFAKVNHWLCDLTIEDLPTEYR